MNRFERLLQDDLNGLIDRIAARAGEDTAPGLTPDLRARIARSEERLTGLRTALLEDYAEWRRALEECEDLWALAVLHQEARVETAPPRAA
jgi:hypothetical protein